MTTTVETAPADQEPAPDEHYLKSAPIMRAIAHLSLPMMLALAAGTVYNIINAYFVGTQHDTALLAALTFGLPLTVILFAVGGVYGAGGSAYITRLLGANERDKIAAVSAFTLWGSAITGALVSVVCLALLNPLVHVLGADASSFTATTDYVRTLLFFAPTFVLAFSAEQVVRATGATRQSMWGLLVSTVVNLLGDVVFILLLGMGVTGAALALGLSSIASIVYYFVYLHLHQPLIAISIRAVRVTRTLLKEVLGVGSSELIQSAFLLVSATLLSNVAVQYGPGLLAGFGVAFRITQLPEALTMGLGLGMLPLFAYATGANDHARLRAALRGAALWIFGITVIFGGLVFLARDQVLQLFSADPTVIQDGTLVLGALLTSTLFNGYTGLILAYFQGTGRAKAAAVLGFALGAFFIPAIIVGNLTLGKVGVAWSLTVSEALACVVGLVLIKFAHRDSKPGVPEASIATELQAAHVPEALSLKTPTDLPSADRA